MKVITILGARPQFIKAAPVSRALRNADHEEIIVHTGQHYDYAMSEIFFSELDIPEPCYNLGVGSGSHAFQTGNIMISLEGILAKEKPDVVLLYGDTNSTLAGALAAVKLLIPIAHVEGGVRAYDMKEPEEVNRVLTDRMASIIFAPTKSAANNLRLEGYNNIVNHGEIVNIDELGPVKQDSAFGVVFNIGDVMYDSSLLFKEMAKQKSKILEELDLTYKKFVLVTIHRPQNTDNACALQSIINGLRRIGKEVTVVFPMHPRVQKSVIKHFGEKFMTELKRDLIVIDPVSYFDILMLEDNSQVIITDSGGIQHEAAFYKVPCVTVTETTEWVESIDNGWNRLCGTKAEEIHTAFVQARESEPDWSGLFCYGYGDAAKRCVHILNRYYGNK